MRADSPGLIAITIALVLVAGLLTGAEAALTTFSRARAEELAALGRPGSKRLVRIVDEPAPYLNTTLFLRTLAEVAAIVLAALMIRGSLGEGWTTPAVAIAVMVVVSFVVIGLAPRTLGRQHSASVALASAGVVVPLTTILGPVPKLLILIGNALTPGKGFSAGPFASEAELRELVDLAEASSVIESDERAMIHSVFELGDTTAREVMVPRTDVVFIERHKTLRQVMSLFLRTGFSRAPVVGEDLDDIIGFAYFKDISRRTYDRHDAETTERVEQVMRPAMRVPDSKPADDLLREMQAQRRHIAVVVDEYGGTAGIVTIEDILEEIVGEITDEYDEHEIAVESLADGRARVPSRFQLDDLADVVGIEVDDDDVDSVGGLMAKLLGRVPIPGSVVEHRGLRYEAEEGKGRRKKIGTVLITRVPVTAEAEREQPAEHSA